MNSKHTTMKNRKDKIDKFIADNYAHGSVKVAKMVTVDLSQERCPACGRSDRWDNNFAQEEPGQNAALVVWCDCGQGELKIVIA